MRSYSITFRGRPIHAEQLFEYGSGRFLVNETYEKSRRYAKFNLPELCTLVSKLPAVSSPIVNVEKLEGGFNKALLLRAENGCEVIAKVPCPKLVPAQWITASEVATLEYLKLHTDVPVPRILAWNSDSSSSLVKSEYIIMEKVSGVQLAEVWENMDEAQKYKLIDNLTGVEGQLAGLEFPGYGSLYHRKSIPQSSTGNTIPVDNEFCLGPAYSSEWYPRFSGGRQCDGPWNDLTDLGQGVALRGLDHVRSSRFLPHGPVPGSKEEHIRILNAAKHFLGVFGTQSMMQQFSKPILWHSDLHLGNIFVDQKDATKINGIIDWQFGSIQPIFMQVTWPKFLIPPEDYQTGPVQLSLPDNFDDMDQDEKDFVRANFLQALRSKRYEMLLHRHHEHVYTVLTQLDNTIKEIYKRPERTFRDGIIPLREAVLSFSRGWEDMGGASEDNPFPVMDDDIKQHERDLARYQNWVQLRQYAEELLQTDNEGWVPPQLDFGTIQKRHDELFQTYMKNEVEAISEEEARGLWFFREGVRERNFDVEEEGSV